MKAKIEKVFTKKQIKDALKVIDEAYKNEIPLGQLRKYISKNKGE